MAKMGEKQKFFEKRYSLAGVMQPNDGTRYKLAAVEMGDRSIEVIVMNDGFFDKIVFLEGRDEPYRTFLGERTNPWTIKAAKQMRDLLILEMEHPAAFEDFILKNGFPNE